jgi:hypothetical protein
VRRDLAAGDVVVVEQPGAFGIAYYWPEAGARWHRTADMANGFLIAFPAGGPIVERNGDMTLEAQLRALARDHDGAAWLISSHRELDGLAELRASYPVEVLHVGVEPVYRLEFAALAPADRALRRREAGPSQPGPWTHAARSGSQP